MENLVVLQPQHKEQILDFEKGLLIDPNDIQAQMKSWDARWRAEALDHYLSMGWSFGQFKEGKLNSYVLAQPFLFFRGLTQTLWVEWLSASDSQGAQSMVDTAYRWARDKHFQALVFEKDMDHSKILKDSVFQVHELNGILFIKTSKMK